MVTPAKLVLQPSKTGLATTATKNAVEQQLPMSIPIQFMVDGPRGGHSHRLGRTQCSVVVLVLDSSVDDGAVGKEEEVLITRGWHGQPDDIAGRSKVCF